MLSLGVSCASWTKSVGDGRHPIAHLLQRPRRYTALRGRARVWRKGKKVVRRVLVPVHSKCDKSNAVVAC